MPLQSAIEARTQQARGRHVTDRTRQIHIDMATTLASWVRAIARTLEAEGIASAPLLEQAGIDRQQLDHPEARCPQNQLNALWSLAVRTSGDEAFGLKVSRQISPTTFHALGYAINASATLREIFERIARYCRVITTAALPVFQRVGNEYQLRLELPAEGLQPSFESIDAFAIIWVRTCRTRIGRAYAPLRVHLRRPQPRDTGPFDAAFRAPIEYGCAENILVFDRDRFERPLDDANPELMRQNEQILVQTLARLEKSDVCARVRALLHQRLPTGEPAAADVASSLHMSLRSLQRKLAEVGTRYDDLLNQTRRDLARAYINEPRYTVCEVSGLLGFADTSSFARAFRRWFGCSPTEFRSALTQR